MRKEMVKSVPEWRRVDYVTACDGIRVSCLRQNCQGQVLGVVTLSHHVGSMPWVLCERGINIKRVACEQSD